VIGFIVVAPYSIEPPSSPYSNLRLTTHLSNIAHTDALVEFRRFFEAPTFNCGDTTRRLTICSGRWSGASLLAGWIEGKQASAAESKAP
jgi:hypothetical protein